MHSDRVSSQLLVSVLFIAVPPNTENSIFFLKLVYVLILDSYICNFIASHTIENNCNMLFLICTGKITTYWIWWLEYVNCTCNFIVCFISLITINLRQFSKMFIALKITSWEQRCLLKCFIVYIV